MELPTSDAALTPERIDAVLKTAQVSDPPPAEYCRLLEIYCVVKAGGIAVQQAVVARLEAQEQASLAQEIQTLSSQPDTESQIESLKQEIQELQQAMADRRAYLATIPPAEEAAVRDCLAAIEAHFQEKGSAE
ncbi:MAG: hypothetical protein HC812_04830 [Leptolyngbya sp. RL_3_1]|nr:hypothetical protein [Leptolyngbya sp. RL_3_1]